MFSGLGRINITNVMWIKMVDEYLISLILVNDISEAVSKTIDKVSPHKK
jgi:hypothetical protein